MSETCTFQFDRLTENTLMIRMTGRWQIGLSLPSIDEVFLQAARQPSIRRIAFNTSELAAWDSSILILLKKIIDFSQKQGIDVEKTGLPSGVQRLMRLANAVPEKKDTRKSIPREPLLDRVGADAIALVRSSGELVAFIGETFGLVPRLIIGRTKFRLSDLLEFIQECGILALPIVTLISFLIGLILAFIGIIQFKLFGAEIYVADLVGIAMVREMGAIMTGIVMAGRTGAAFAAQLGTMQVNEEIDALQTLGIDPIEFLVLPRMLGLSLMMPLLCLYANLMGIIGGGIVAVLLYGANLSLYFNRTVQAVGLNDLFIGLFMSFVFGILVALSGCLRGMQCGRSASAVGDAATSAVVTGIVAIIVSTAIITVMCDVLGV